VNKIKKYIKRKCRKGFTFLIVPNSPGAVRSCAIPFSAALLILGIVIFNIYIFVGYTTQIWQIQKYRYEIRVKNSQISKLEKEQREVQPTLKRSYQIAAELSRLKVEREKLLSSWKAIQQKGGRVASTTSRGVVYRPRPYTINSVEHNSTGIKTELMELQNNLAQIDEFIKNEKELQRELLKDFIAYETKLDHTPSIWPVSSYIISGFGTRFHPVHKRYITHTGVDLKARYTSVKAAADGVVEFSGYQGGYGYVVIIRHGYGYKTLYAHNSKLLVTKGQKVKKGQKISVSGNSGVSTGPHLHYEVRINNVPVNPVMFLKN
jgi:murein DD-endopeptidase MepM/ murein hydrolase activator NlpD